MCIVKVVVELRGKELSGIHCCVTEIMVDIFLFGVRSEISLNSRDHDLAKTTTAFESVDLELLITVSTQRSIVEKRQIINRYSSQTKAPS